MVNCLCLLMLGYAVSECYSCCMLEPSDDAGKLKETEEKKRVQIEGPMTGGALETGSYGIKFHIN